MSKYEKLLAVSTYYKDNPHHHNYIHVNDNSRSIISTNGCALLADRTLYQETKVLARLMDANMCLRYVPDTNLLIVDDKTLDLNSVIPSSDELATAYKRVRLTLPTWLNYVKKPKRDKKAITVTITQGDVPAIVIGNYGYGTAFDIALLKEYIGMEVDIYLHPNTDKPAIITPTGVSFDNSDWFYILMPINKENGSSASYR